MTDINDVRSTRNQAGISRRTVMKGAAWTAPLLLTAVAAPAYAASPPVVLPKAFSSWGTTGGSISGRNCTGSSGRYTWWIDNTSSSGLSYHGVLFPNATATLKGQQVSNVINVYWLPFNSGTISDTAGTTPAGPLTWTTLAYDSSYGTVSGPSGRTYYAWVTKLAGPVTVTAAMIDGNDVFHLTPDYKFTVTGNTCVNGGDLYVSHAYTYSLNGTPMTNPTPCNSYNGNYCGKTAAYPGTGTSDQHWRNNGWVGSLADD